MPQTWPLRFGIFLPPMHKTGINPHLALHRDLELVEHLDRLGYDEAWIGEHHSAGSELIQSPEVFIATAAERTRTIKLGTGVNSLPYHHPFAVAETMAQLDHITIEDLCQRAYAKGKEVNPYQGAPMTEEQKKIHKQSVEAWNVLFERQKPLYVWPAEVATIADLPPSGRLTWSASSFPTLARCSVGDVGA